jgi:phosphoribosylpyrophosphate synthetase
LDQAVFTDSFNLPADFAQLHPWFAQVSLAELLAETIANIHQESSVSHVYLDDDL